MNAKLISDIKRQGKTVKGKKELLKHLDGGQLTSKQAIQTKCFDCTGYFADGRQDCKLSRCPLHPAMNFNTDKRKRKAARVQ